MRDIVGAAPVHPVLLLTGKAGAAFCWAILGLRLAGVNLLGTTIAVMRWPAAIVGAAGSFVIVAALVRLGEAARVGLPRSETTLKTTGLYAVTRNPIYAAGLAVCFASCVYVPHWLNILSLVVTAVIHHRIVLAEERFLSQRFDEEWDDYRRRVRRY